MHERDAFFTQSIVSPPFTVFLGQRMRAHPQGLQLDMASGAERFSEGWRDWVALGRSTDLSGIPRRRPGPLTRWLERRALPLALAGVCCLGAGALLFGLSRWP